MQELKDTQSEADTRNISIDRVGVKGLRFPIQIQDKLNRIQSTVATVSLAVDLPEEFKGTHMSRFVEALHQHGPLLDVHTALAIPRELLRRLSLFLAVVMEKVWLPISCPGVSATNSTRDGAKKQGASASASPILENSA